MRFRIPALAENRQTVGAVVLFKGSIGKLVIPALNRCKGILERAGVQLFVKPGLVDHLIFLIVVPAHLRVQGGALHALAVQAKIAFHTDAAFFIQFTGQFLVARRQDGFAIHPVIRLLDEFLGCTVDSPHFRIPCFAQDLLSIRAVVDFPRHIAELIIFAFNGGIRVLDRHGRSAFIEPGFTDGLFLFIPFPADLGISVFAQHPAAVRSMEDHDQGVALFVALAGIGGILCSRADRLPFCIQIGFPDDETMIIQFALEHGIPGRDQDRRVIRAEVGFLRELLACAVDPADAGKALRGQDGLAVGSIVLFIGDIAELVIVPVDRGIGVPEGAGIQVFIKPGFMNHLIVFVIGFPNLGIQCRALHALPADSEIAFDGNTALFVQFTRQLLIAGGGQDRFTLDSKVGLFQQFLGCAVHSVRFRIAAIAEDRSSVGAVVLFVYHIGEFIVVPVHGRIGILERTGLQVLIEPGFIDHLVFLVVEFPDLRIQTRALHTLPVQAKVALSDHTALVIQFAGQFLIPARHQDRFARKSVERLLHELLRGAVDAADFRIARLAEDFLSVRTVIDFQADIAEVIIGALDSRIGILERTRRKVFIHPGFVDHLVCLIVGFAHLRIQGGALDALAVKAKVALDEHTALVVQFTRQLLVAGRHQDRFAIHPVIRLLDELLGCAVDSPHFRVACFAQDLLSVGAIVDFPGHIAELVIFALHGGIGILDRARGQVFIKPGFPNDPFVFVVGSANLRIPGTALSPQAVHAKIALNENIALFIELTGHPVIARGGKNRLALHAKAGLFGQLLGGIVDALHFRVPGFAEHGPSVRTVILFIDHIAGIIVVAVHRAVGVLHRAHVSGRIQPDLMDHLARVVVLASHLGVAGGGSDAAAADIQVAFAEHTALVIQVAHKDGIAGGIQDTLTI